MAVGIAKLCLMDAMTGEEITHIDLGEPFRARFKDPYAVVHRGICRCSAQGMSRFRTHRTEGQLRSCPLRSMYANANLTVTEISYTKLRTVPGTAYPTLHTASLGTLM
jgi:hypothetical protein